MGSIYSFYCVCFHLSVLLFFSLRSSSISLGVGEAFVAHFNDTRTGFCILPLPPQSPSSFCYSFDHLSYGTSLESETPLADCTTTVSPSNDSVTQSLRLSTGGNMEVTYYIVNGFKLKFSINVTGDGPYFTPYKEIFSSIVSSTPITNSNFTTSPDFATVYLYIDTMYFSLTYSQPTFANFSDVPQTGVGFSYGPIYNNNTLSLGIAASWNRTWYYDLDISAAFGGLGGKDVGGGGSGSDGDDGYIALYTVLPCVAIISVALVSFLVLVSVWVTCYVLRKRRVNKERKVNF